MGEARSLDAMDVTHSFHQAVEVSRSIWNRVDVVRYKHTHRDKIVGAEAEVDRGQPLETAQQQPRSNGKHQSQSNFGDHQSLAHAPVAANSGARGPLLKRVEQIDARQAQRGQKAEE